MLEIDVLTVIRDQDEARWKKGTLVVDHNETILHLDTPKKIVQIIDVYAPLIPNTGDIYLS